MNPEKIPIFEIPLKPQTNDYDEIKYQEGFTWLEEDKQRFKNLLKEIYNSTDLKEEKNVDTSQGQVLITSEPYPNVGRRKLIKGYLLKTEVFISPESKETIIDSENLSDNDDNLPTYLVYLKNGNCIKLRANKYQLQGDKYFFYNSTLKEGRDSFFMASKVTGIVRNPID